MTVFGCADAHGVIVYNGIGLDDAGATPSDWLLELSTKEKLFDYSLPEVLAGVRIDMENRLKPIHTRYGSEKARHSFIFAVWHHGISVLYGVSNYERVDDDHEAQTGSEKVSTSMSLPAPGAKTRILATGVHPPRNDLRAIAEAIKRAPLNRVKALCVKAVKDVAYGKGKSKGTVGASCQWAFVGPKRDEVSYGLDVVGGAIAQETPNLINIGASVHVGGTQFAQLGGPGMIVKDAYVGNVRASNLGQWDDVKKSFSFSEPTCGICGAPWPRSHRFCEVCLYEGTG
jgi:hypothetical protein